MPILGRVDEAWFRSGNVELVVERKFTESLRPFDGHLAQARLYCLGLEGMGFDTPSTRHTILTFRRICHTCPKLVDRTCPIFEHDRKEFHCKKGQVRAFSYPFDRKRATDELDWALDYWLSKRDAIPSRKPAKCHVCRHKSCCEDSLAEDDSLSNSLLQLF